MTPSSTDPTHCTGCPDVPDSLPRPALDVPVLDHLFADEGQQVSVFHDDTDRCYDEWLMIDAEHAVEMPYC